VNGPIEETAVRTVVTIGETTLFSDNLPGKILRGFRPSLWFRNGKLLTEQGRQPGGPGP
jgi:hypothetical protein